VATEHSEASLRQKEFLLVPMKPRHKILLSLDEDGGREKRGTSFSSGTLLPAKIESLPPGASNSPVTVGAGGGDAAMVTLDKRSEMEAADGSDLDMVMKTPGKKGNEQKFSSSVKGICDQAASFL